MNDTFRETDVIGRIGGDEFVVAGQFDENAILSSIERLQENLASVNAEAGRKFNLSLSLGFAVNEGNTGETLKGLLTRADAAMYDVKRLKKQSAR